MWGIWYSLVDIVDIKIFETREAEAERVGEGAKQKGGGRTGNGGMQGKGRQWSEGEEEFRFVT